MVNTNLAKFDHALFAAQPLDPNPELHHFLLTALELHKRLRLKQIVTIDCLNSSLIAAEAKLEPAPNDSMLFRLTVFCYDNVSIFQNLHQVSDCFVLDIWKGSK
jgi:hypothetical protein